MKNQTILIMLRCLLLTGFIAHNAYGESLHLLCKKSFLKILNITPKSTLRKTKAKKLAQLIAVDSETQELVSNPWIAQYIYINYFAKEAGHGELKHALQELVDDIEAGNKDLFSLVNEKLASKLNDPEVQLKVAKAFKEDGEALRPGKLNGALAKMRSKLRQVRGIFKTIGTLREDVYKGFSQEVMDRGLFDFYGATQIGLKDSQLRKWDNIPGGFSSIRPGQIENIDPETWSDIAHFAAETEAPIHQYSTNSGDAIRAFMPSVAAFMGKNEEQLQAYKILDDPGPFCTNVWCREENRHEFAVDTIAERAFGRPKLSPKTYKASPPGDYSDPDYAIKHLIERNSSEWNANSVYFLLRAHSTGAANKWVDQIRLDETKHMAIFSAAFKYIAGSQYNLRTKGMLSKIQEIKKEASQSNSNGNILEKDGLTLFEMLITHLFVEKKVRDFLKTLPLKTMEKFFDSPVKTLTELPSVPVPPEKQKVIDEMMAQEKKKRKNLERWAPKERKKYLELKKIEEENDLLIESLIRNLFNNFYGAEIPGSKSAIKILKQINKLNTGLDGNTNSYIKMSLQETFRDYQIMNNSYIRKRKDLGVILKSATEGFIIEKKVQGQTEIILKKQLTHNHFLVRIDRPPGLVDISPGAPFRLSIKTPHDGEQSRILSLSSSPNKEYLEFAVTDSSSSFKKMLKSLQPGSEVNIEKLDAGIKFKKGLPAVMIAGGIGITPFRSMIQFAYEQNLKTPISLIYGNRTQIPFKYELDQLDLKSEAIKVTHILSRPDDSWKGDIGRIDSRFLNHFVPNAPKEAIYYIVGSPTMVSSTQKSLMAMGIPKERILIETFLESDTPTSKSIKKSNMTKEGQTDETICFCQDVTRGQIELAVKNGTVTFEEIQELTNVSRGCGGCTGNVKKIISAALKK